MMISSKTDVTESEEMEPAPPEPKDLNSLTPESLSAPAQTTTEGILPADYWMVSKHGE